MFRSLATSRIVCIKLTGFKFRPCLKPRQMAQCVWSTAEGGPGLRPNGSVPNGSVPNGSVPNLA